MQSPSIRANYGTNPYGTLGPSPSRAMIINRSGPPKEDYFTYKKPGKNRDAKDVIKLLAGQKLQFLEGKGYYAVPKGRGSGGPSRVVPRGGAGAGAGSSGGSLLDIAKAYAAMMSKNQQGVLDKLLADSGRRNQGELASLAGFGAALQGYSHDLWGQTDEGYRNAAAAQQSIAQGLGGQVGSGVAEMHAQEAALAGQTGYTGGTPLASADAAAKQVASEGGAETGAMMGQVGTAWGGYGATRPEYIGFMTGQNQMQLMREHIDADKDLKNEFLKLGMGNMEQGLSVAMKLQEAKAAQSDTSWKKYMDRQNLGLEISKMKMAGKELNIKDKQFWAELNQKQTQFNADNEVDWAGIGVDKTNAKTRQKQIEATQGSKAATAYNTLYGKLYGLAQGGAHSPLYTKVTSGPAALGPNATAAEKIAAAMSPSGGQTVSYKKKPYAQARAALLARAAPFMAQNPGLKKQILSDIDYLLGTMGFSKQAAAPKPTAAPASTGPDLASLFYGNNPFAFNLP